MRAAFGAVSTITDLMKAVQSGAAQLPDFRRGRVRDDSRTESFIVSIIHAKAL